MEQLLLAQALRNFIQIVLGLLVMVAVERVGMLQILAQAMCMLLAVLVGVVVVVVALAALASVRWV